MKKLIGIFTILLISGVVAFAQNSKPLSDRQMDRITAGNSGGHDDGGGDDDGGGNKNGGTATVAVSGGALSGVTAVNLVVSADSTVVSGINVFSGNTASTSNAPTPAPAKKGDDKGGDHHGDNDNNAGLTQSNDISVNHTSKNSSTSSVTVSDNAESGVTATNLVNAASSVVVSGLNVAQMNTLNTSSITQANKISVNH